MKELFSNIYNNKTVFVTGHTGFKGSWLCLWLKEMGANIIGYSLEAESEYNHFNLLQLDMISIIGDIRDSKKLNSVLHQYQPDIVFHLAAQALVRKSYLEPVDTFSINIMGTINLLEACRHVSSIKAIVNVTTDKCYENRDWHWPYRENEALGGHDPYSTSKACSELITASYRKSFVNENNLLIATARAGNVIGGGDWAEDRLIPDLIKNCTKGQVTKIRNPKAIRPWQHVLDALSAYLVLGQNLIEGKSIAANAWNFGPSDETELSVMDISKLLQNEWNFQFEFQTQQNELYEAQTLKLDCSKAKNVLKWQSLLDNKTMLKITIDWYKHFYKDRTITSHSQLQNYVNKAREANFSWTSS